MAFHSLDSDAPACVIKHSEVYCNARAVQNSVQSFVAVLYMPGDDRQCSAILGRSIALHSISGRAEQCLYTVERIVKVLAVEREEASDLSPV